VDFPGKAEIVQREFPAGCPWKVRFRIAPGKFISRFPVEHSFPGCIWKIHFEVAPEKNIHLTFTQIVLCPMQLSTQFSGT
jgi:hypothetical protein